MHKKSFALAVTIAAVMTTLAMPASARSIADSTGVNPLHGVVGKKDQERDDFQREIRDQINGGGDYEPSWTLFFLGEKKCGLRGTAIRPSDCATILPDGRIRFDYVGLPPFIHPTPRSIFPTGPYTDCGHSLAASPKGMSYLTGSRPTGWELFLHYTFCDGSSDGF